LFTIILVYGALPRAPGVAAVDYVCVVLCEPRLMPLQNLQPPSPLGSTLSPAC